MEKSKENKKKGIIGTAIFHSVLLLLFLFTGLTIPVPMPEEEGLPVQLDLGNTDFGSGDEQPQSTSEPENTEPVEPEPVETNPTEAPEEVATQDSPSDMTVPETKKPVEKPVEKKPELDERLQKVFDSNPFKTNKDNDSKGQGDSDKAGDHGKPDGSPDGSALTGNKQGGGLSANLGGRKAKNLRPIPGNWQEEGMIVISVIVDRDGNVVKTSVGRGTNITNASLLKAAEAEARKVKFTPKSNAPAEQRGEIYYPVVLQ